MSHCERTGARGQFKIVSFSQEWFFPEASCCFNLKKAASSSLSSWALCLHTPYLSAVPLSLWLYISLSFSWVFPSPPFFVSLQACAVAMRVLVCLEMCPSSTPGLYLGGMQVCSPSFSRRDLCRAFSGVPMGTPARTRTARHAVWTSGPCWPKCLLIAKGSGFRMNHHESLS